MKKKSVPQTNQRLSLPNKPNHRNHSPVRYSSTVRHSSTVVMTGTKISTGTETGRGSMIGNGMSFRSSVKYKPTRDGSSSSRGITRTGPIHLKT